jgi:hypothetical protein
MTQQNLRGAEVAGTSRPRSKGGVALAFFRLGTGLRGALASLWRFGVRPPLNPVPPRSGQFPSLASAEREYRALREARAATGAEPFATRDPTSPPARAAIVPARPPSGSRPYVGH